MTDAAGGFFDRWSRRKREQRVAPAAAVPEAANQADRAIADPRDLAGGRIASAPMDTRAASTGTPAPELPTMADAERLTPDSDFKPFVARGVAPGVRNAAMKKLFADPHFNVMDGLDTYIDDYSVSDPIPVAMLRQMASAKFLNLFADADADESAAPADSPAPAEPTRVDADTVGGQMLAQSAEPRQTVLLAAYPMPDAVPVAAPAPEPEIAQIDHDHPDLRLQPDHAAAAGRAGRGPA